MNVGGNGQAGTPADTSPASIVAVRASRSRSREGKERAGDYRDKQGEQSSSSSAGHHHHHHSKEGQRGGSSGKSREREHRGDHKDHHRGDHHRGGGEHLGREQRADRPEASSSRGGEEKGDQDEAGVSDLYFVVYTHPNGRSYLMEATSNTAKSDDKLIKKEGWVLKQGPPPWKTWKKRWLVLTPQGLSYYRGLKGKDNKTLLELKGTVPANMISTVELMAINKKKGIFGFKVDVPARSYIFAPQPEKLSLSEKEAQGWMDAVLQLIGNNQRRRKQVQKVSTLKKKKKRPPQEESAKSLFDPPSNSSEHIERADANARLVRSQPAAQRKASSSSSRRSREKEEKEKKEERDRKSKSDSRHRSNSKEDRRSKSDSAKDHPVDKAKAELKRLEEERKAELAQIVERYSKQRNAIIDALIDKEVAAVVALHDQEKQAILSQIKLKSIQM